MSIIQTIRDKAAVFVFIIIGLSLIGFLVQDAFVGGGPSMNAAESTVGTVNGVKIDREVFDARVRMAEAQYQSQGYRVDQGMRQEIQTQVWNALINKEVVNKEAKKLGLAFTSKEFSDLLFSDDAPMEFKQQFTDQQTGQYNIEAARTQFRALQRSNDPAQIKMVNEQLIEPIILNQLQGKILQIFANGAYVPTWLVEKQNALNGQVANIELVNIPYTTIADSAVNVSDAEIDTYIQKHKNQYKQEASRSISYVLFDASPNKADSTNLWNKLEELKQPFAEAEDASIFVTRQSTKTPFFDNYINKSRIQIPVKDSLFGLANGEVYGPYYDASSIVLAKMLDSKVMPDSVRARHILIGTLNPQTGQPTLADSTAKQRADSIHQAIKNGASFETLVLQYSDDEGSKMQLGDLGYFANGQMVKNFNDFCFAGKKGDKGVVKTEFGYHYIEVQDQKNFEIAYKIAYLSKEIEASGETNRAAESAATQFASASRTTQAFDDNVVSQGLNKRITEEIKEMDYNLPGVGASREFVKWVFNNKPGTVSSPMSIGDQYIVATITGERAKGVQSAHVARMTVEPVLRNEKKAAKLKEEIGTVTDLNALAVKYNQTPTPVDSIRFTDNFKPAFGSESIVIGASFNVKNKEKPSSVLKGGSGAFVLQIKDLYAVPNPAGSVEEQKKALASQLQQNIAYSVFQALSETADIKDNRLKAGY